MQFKDLSVKYGTPLFVYDTDSIKLRIKYLANILENMDICYAIKANSFVIKEIKDDIKRVEVCSYGEYEICKKMGVDNQKIVLSGVYKNEEEFEQIFKGEELVLRFTIESLEQFRLLLRLALKYKKRIDVLIRLTSGNQFGVREEDIDDIIANKNDLINIKGIEFFSGTQKHSLKRITKECEYLREVIDRINNKYNINLEEIEYGPGFPVYYFQGDEFLEEEFLKEFKEIINTYFKEKVILEIGRSIVASSGYYLTKVVDIKENQNGKFVILDGGINHLVYYGQTMAMKIPYYEIINKDINKKEEVVSLFGSLCTINDILVKQLEVPKLEIGDVFVFKNVGAYSITEGISLFLSRKMPKVVLLCNRADKIVRDEIDTAMINCPKEEY